MNPWTLLLRLHASCMLITATNNRKKGRNKRNRTKNERKELININ